ncbi:hypothetical protein ACWEQJ_34610, partial [Streptomyces cyaneofuscatus]
MNDRQNPYGHDPYYQQPQIIGYDEYGQPVYQQQGQQGGQQGGQQYDPYAAQQGQGQVQGQGQSQAQDTGYGYDPYGQAQQPQAYDPYAGQQHPQQDQGGQGTDQGYGQGADQRYGQSQGQGYGYGGYTDYGSTTGQQPAAVDTDQWNIPQQAAAPAPEQAPQQHAPQPAARPTREQAPEREPAAEEDPAVPGQRGPAPDYRTEQFSFIEEPDEDSEDVIDWLKFTESLLLDGGVGVGDLLQLGLDLVADLLG